MDTKARESRTGRQELSLFAIEPLEAPRVDLFGALLALAEHKRLIVGMSMAGALLAGLAAFQMPNVYTATAVIMPPAPQRGNLSLLLGSSGSPIPGAQLGSGPGDLLRSPAELYMSLLSSRSVADDVVGGQGLQEYYRAKHLTGARSTLAGSTRLTTGKDSLIRIAVKDRDPKRAASIANAYIESLYRLNSRFAVTESAQRRQFFDRQLESEKKELLVAEAEMRAIQERTGLVQVNSQTEVVIRSMAQLRAEITSREVMLEGLLSGATDQNPEVIRQRSELETLRARLKQLQNAPGADSNSGMPASRLPGAGLEYLRALRNLKYHETLFEVLAKQRETARIDEAKQATVVQVVDYAVPPEVKSGPSRLLFVLLGGASQALLAMGIVLTRRTLREPEAADRWRTLRRALWSPR